MKNLFTKNKTYTFISVVFLIALWKAGSLMVSSEFILPSPEKTFFSLIQLTTEPEFFNTLGSTILRGLLGFFISFILALSLGILAGIHEKFRAFLQPLLVTIRSTPVISLILLALIWFNVNQVPVFIALLTMFPFICTNIIDGIRDVDHNLIQMAQVYRTGNKNIIRHIYIPAIMPYIFSGTSSAMGFGWRAIIIGEVLSQPTYGIGTLMQSAQTYLLTDRLIAWTVLAIIISYFFDLLIRFIEKQSITWKQT